MKINLQPEEWDFREITETELATAIDYEFARENKPFRSRAAAWLDSKINGRSVRTQLLDGVGLEKLCRKEYSAQPCDLQLLIEREFLSQFPLFPLPWLALHPNERREYCNGLPILPSVRLLPMSHSDSQRFVGAMLRNPKLLHGYWLTINFGRVGSKAALMKELKREVDLLWMQSAKNAQGKASSLPFRKLKQLAALRLSAAGLNLKGAKDAISNRLAAKQMISEGDVIPSYGSPGAWHGAVSAAQKLASAWSVLGVR